MENTSPNRKEKLDSKGRRPATARRQAPSPAVDQLYRITHAHLSLPESRQRPFSSPGWIFEVSYDGQRCLARRSARAHMFSRQGWDMSHAFPELINELNELPKGTAIDGELLMFDEDGRPERNRLLGLPALSRPGSVVRAVRSKAATIVCWDLLMLNGRDLRTHPLLERKAALHKLIRSHRSIQYAGHVADAGERMFAEAQFLSLEGIVAKRAQSLYVAGQTRDWLKIRTAAGRSAQTLRKGEAEVHR